jgi:hypothetical protein
VVTTAVVAVVLAVVLVLVLLVLLVVITLVVTLVVVLIALRTNRSFRTQLSPTVAVRLPRIACICGRTQSQEEGNNTDEEDQTA